MEKKIYNIEANMKKIEKTREYSINREIAISIALISFFAFMMICAVCRLFGINWATVTYVDVYIPTYIEFIILCGYYVLESIFILKIITSIKWKFALIISICCKIVQIPLPNDFLTVIVDFAVVFVIPLFINKNKRHSIAKSIMTFLGISGYQLLMRYARYCDATDGKYNVIWQILSTIDYKLFIVSIYLFKEVIVMKNKRELNPGCFFFWGKFDDLCRKIGNIFVKPFIRHD